MNDDETIDFSTRRFELQKSLFEKGIDQVQKQIIHLDDILFKIKASAITVWVALMGWSFTSSKTEIVPLGLVIIIGFWLLEAMFKGAQVRYIEISSNLMRMVNDTDSLQNQFEMKNFEDGTIYPVALNLTEIDRLILMGRGIISPSVATVYLFLGFANALVWIAFG
jgi:hypothetical protein